MNIPASVEELASNVDLGFPVDVEKAAQFLGIDVEKTKDANRLRYSGEITVEGERPKIWINPVDSKTRQRFTLAHEIGHYILHLTTATNGVRKFTDNVDTLRRGASWDPIEYAANSFAARLLMPADKIKEKGLDLSHKMEEEEFSGPIVGSDEFVARLAKAFVVSPQAMKLRLKNLGIIK